jgi:hypothetical protein
MPKQSLPPYQCPRCGYETRQKPCMREHLFTKKKPCPGIKSIMELTPDIKEHVLIHRIFSKPNGPNENNTKFVINQYNQYNNINNIVAGMDAIEKINHYMNFNKQELLDFETTVERKYKKAALDLDIGKVPNFSMREDKLIEIVGRASDSSQFDNTHNVIYDNKLKEIKIYDGSWEFMSLDAGTKHYLERIQRNFLDAYERYLLRNIKNSRQAQDRAAVVESLERYFAFIGCFDLDPYCQSANDDEIMKPISCSDDIEEDDNASYDDCDLLGLVAPPKYTLQDEFHPLYKKVLKSLTKAQINKMIRNVQDMIKRNSARNISELNKKITRLFHMDETFRDVLLSIQKQ